MKTENLSYSDAMKMSKNSKTYKQLRRIELHKKYRELKRNS